MSDMEKVAAAPGFDKNKFWMGVYFALMFFMCVGFYWATTQTQYIWHWNRIPGYFYINEKHEVRAEIEGEVSSITHTGGNSVVIVMGNGQSEHYTIPGNEILVSKGDFIYMGDTLGTYEQGQIGLLVKGLIITIEISFIAIIFGIVLGLLTGLARISSNPCLKWCAITYIEIIRGTPLLVQIIMAYFVFATIINDLLAKISIPQIPSTWIGVASLAVFAGAYVAEIVRAGIQSIHKGQMEAARSLGMTKSTAMIKIILPQAFKRILPPLAGQFISLIKDSSLLGVIAITELTKATREAVTTSLMPYELWFVCALMYLIITFALSMFVQYLEKRTAEA